ncbi:MAG: hypothetical protein L6R41_001872 [Letrouitia leprolyta]|nr:MAG: hypothetical protein L6R41_001872 [Letrouitia leprolyta]
MSDQGHIWDWLHHVHQALDAISNGGDAFSSSSSSTHLRGASPPSPWDVHQAFHTDSNARQWPWQSLGDNATESLPGSERPGSQETGVNVWQQWIHAPRPTMATAGVLRKLNSQESLPEPVRQTATAGPVQQASPVEVFTPPMPRTPVPDPVKSSVTIGKIQRASLVEVFPRPHLEGPMPDPIKSQATARESPFRPARTIRRVGRLISRDEMPLGGFGGGKKEAQDLRDYVFIPE